MLHTARIIRYLLTSYLHTYLLTYLHSIWRHRSALRQITDIMLRGDREYRSTRGGSRHFWWRVSFAIIQSSTLHMNGRKPVTGETYFYPPTLPCVTLAHFQKKIWVHFQSLRLGTVTLPIINNSNRGVKSSFGNPDSARFAPVYYRSIYQWLIKTNS